MTLERTIGREGGLPWRLPMPSVDDRFNKITTDAGIVVMGYNTYASILAKDDVSSLVGRYNIVLTSRFVLKGALIESVSSVDEALKAIAARGGRACITGGAETYRQFLPHVNTAYLTFVQAHLMGDTRFPEIGTNWQCVESYPAMTRARDNYPTSFVELRRKAN